MLSVIVPTLNVGEGLYDCLAALRSGVGSGLVGEIIVIDGGSQDATQRIARSAGARVLTHERGRGQQLQRGAMEAQGSWFLFLHGDTVLEPDWLFAAEQFVEDPNNLRSAAYFRFRLDDDTREARRLERIVAWRSRALGLPYGDQGLLMSRLYYAELGGYRPLPLMEDVDLVRRIGRRRLVALDVRATTSAQRYRRHGYLSRSLRNLLCLGLYYLGLPPRLLLGLYR